MKILKNSYFCFCLLTALTCCGTVFAAEGNSESVSSKKIDLKDLNINEELCTKEVLMNLYPAPILKAILEQHSIPADKADAISRELAKRSQDSIDKIVEEKASKMDPNPFNDLTKRDEAGKIFRETVFEVFARVLNAHGIVEDDTEKQAILDEMQEIKGKLFFECIKKEQNVDKHAL